MNRLLLLVYSVLPNGIRKFVGGSKFLKPLRDTLLRIQGKARTIVTHTQWGDSLFFYFKSDLRTALKLKKKPLEGLLLRQSISLLSAKEPSSNKIIIDIGASYGYLSVVWAKTVAKRGRIYSFEVNPHVFSCLHFNVVENKLDAIITPINQPVFSKSESIAIDDGPSGSTLQKGETRIDNRVYKQAISIDDFFEKENIQFVDMIKVDVDGPDYEVLLGAEKTLTKHKPIVIVEYNNDDRIPEWLKKLGYSLFDLRMQPFVNQKEINLICIPK